MAEQIEDPQKTLEGQFDPENPADWAKYWEVEFAAARDEGGEDWGGIRQFQSDGRKIVKRYRASKKGSKRKNDARINIFPANIQTLRSILVGQVPKCQVERRHGDPDDDIGRIAANILERILNSGMEDEGSGFVKVMSQVTEDRLLPGLGCARVQFAADMETVPEVPARMGPCRICKGTGSIVSALEDGPGFEAAEQVPPPGQGEPCPQCGGSGQVELAPAIPAHDKQANEAADAIYSNWQDQLWSQARTFEDVRWWAFSAPMSRQQLVEMFGPVGSEIPLNIGKGKSRNKEAGDATRDTPWARAQVWEIWSKEHKRLFWRVEGFPRVFWPIANPGGEDALGLEGFWPFPPPLIANQVSDAYLPTPDFVYAEDLYNEADNLTARIRGIVKAIKVAGVRDQTNEGLNRLLDEACELELVPMSNWAEFMTKGGIAAAFQLLPIGEMVQTVQALVAERNLVIESIFQVTGLGDIIRGQQNQSETATTSAIKARFASVRLRDLQKEVARYATGLQRLRKEIIAKHFSPETIIERSAIMFSPDAQSPDGQQKIVAAVKLIKDRHLDFQVTIKPEQIALQDWAQLKQQRSEVLTSLGGFLNQAAPLVQLAQTAGPQGVQAAVKFVLSAGKWLVAGMPGASGAESAFDAFVQQVEQLAQAAAQQPPAPPKPDPKVQSAMVKAQGDVMKTKAATQGRLVEIAAETRANMAQREHDAQMDVATAAATSEAKMRLDAVRAVGQVTGPVIGGVQ